MSSEEFSCIQIKKRLFQYTCSLSLIFLYIFWISNIILWKSVELILDVSILDMLSANLTASWSVRIIILISFFSKFAGWNNSSEILRLEGRLNGNDFLSISISSWISRLLRVTTSGTSSCSVDSLCSNGKYFCVKYRAIY